MKYRLTTFPNGLRLIAAPLPSTQAVTVLVLVKVGSRYEIAKLNGSSHFIEHLMFKGTKKRLNTLILSQELDNVGAEYNAYTSKDHTGFYIKLDAKHLHLAIDMLSDMLFNSKFESAEINRERGTIIEEINMYEDNPLIFASAFLEQVLFSKDNSLGRLVIGPKENIKNITRQELLNYRDSFYQPANIVIGVSGNFNSIQLNKLVKKYFSRNYQLSITRHPKLGERRVINYQHYTHSQSQPRIEIKYKSTEQTQLCLGWPAYHYLHPDIEALTVLNVILGANMSSRLFINIRERRGLCYFIKSDFNPYEDTGSFIIQAGLAAPRLEESITLILKEIKKIKQEKVLASELQKAKDYLRGRAILNLEDSSSVADWYASQELLTNKIETPVEKLRQIDQVSSNDVKRVAADIFKLNQTNLALIGSHKFPQTLLKLIK